MAPKKKENVVTSISTSATKGKQKRKKGEEEKEKEEGDVVASDTESIASNTSTGKYWIPFQLYGLIEL